VQKALERNQLVCRLRNKVRPPLPLFRLLNRGKRVFECPICSYQGPFADFSSFAGSRKHAVCPSCGALERHRLQYLVVMGILADVEVQKMKMLHFAPEKFLRSIFSRGFLNYETADLFMKGVDHTVDARNLPFEDGAYDLVFASHVLEHIREDRQAVREIKRVLGSRGIAVLPVPIVCAETIEYPCANPKEAGHVRAPGLDYFERYKESFGRIEVYSSGSFPEKHQLFIYEDRSVWPTKECPLRPPMEGEIHADFVPVCYV
jgi:SAM-dependent methyltransferase